MRRTRIVWIDARRILPLHEIRRPHHFHELVARMRRSGWQGRPLVAERLSTGRYKQRGKAHYMGWTGTHRLAAARALGMKVPVVLVAGGKPLGRKPLASRTFTDPHRYKMLRRRRDPTAVLLAAEIKINALCDKAGVL